jgi:NRAMP (natural resistance-associated macrophage protein)-like metal ion transporter
MEKDSTKLAAAAATTVTVTPNRDTKHKRPAHRKLLFYLSMLGPGLIAANAGNDAGGIATYSQMGTQYGYSLLWVMVIITFSLAIVQEMCARLGAATGKGLSDLIRENFGVRITALVMLGLLIANALVLISDFIGIAAALDIFGIPVWLGTPLAGLGLWLLISRGSYGRVEKIFLVMTLAFFAYVVAALISKPEWGQVAVHSVVPTVKLDSAYIQTLMAAIGTTITPYMQLFLQSAVVEKGVTMQNDYKYERNEVLLGVLFSDLISFFIIVACAATLFASSPLGANGEHTGSTINTARDAALALGPLLGNYATYVFAFGLLGASLLACGVLPIATSYSITEAFGLENGVSRKFREAPAFWGIFTCLILISTAVAIIPGVLSNVVTILLIVQIINGMILPFLLVVILLLINNKELMGQYTNGRIYNVSAWATVIFVSGLSVILLATTILGLFGINILPN